MTTRLVDLVAAAAVLVTGTPDVPVLAVRTGTTSGQAPDRPPRWMKVKVLAGSWEAAERLAGWWALPEDPGRWSGETESDGCRLRWRTWSGWIQDPSRPVEVTVTAAERRRVSVAAIGPTEVAAS